MARKRNGVKKPSTPFLVLAELHKVPAVGVRELRTRFKEACEAGVPLIVTRGNREVAVFLPIKIEFYATEKEIVRASKKLVEQAKIVALHLGRS